MNIKLLILSLLCLTLIHSEIILEDNVFETYRNKTSLKRVMSVQLATTNTELNQQDLSIDYTKDKKNIDLEKPTLFQTSLSAIISTTIRSTLKNIDLISKGYFDQLLKLVAKDVGSSLVMKSIFWFIPKKFKTMTQMSMFVLTNSYICFGKTWIKALNHLIKEILKLIGYIVLLKIISDFTKNFIVKAIYFGFLSFFWDFMIKTMIDRIFDNIA
jgi:hypothetical protein